MQFPLHNKNTITGKPSNQTSQRLLDACLAAAVLLILCFPIIDRAQQSQYPSANNPPAMPGAGAEGAPAPDPSMRRMVAQMALKRNSQRQQQIVADTAHLLDLAQKLNNEVSRSTKDQLSISVVKDADEIEKLAKSIKDKMRDGQ